MRSVLYDFDLLREQVKKKEMSRKAKQSLAFGLAVLSHLSGWFPHLAASMDLQWICKSAVLCTDGQQMKEWRNIMNVDASVQGTRGH